MLHTLYEYAMLLRCCHADAAASRLARDNGMHIIGLLTVAAIALPLAAYALPLPYIRIRVYFIRYAAFRHAALRHHARRHAILPTTRRYADTYIIDFRYADVATYATLHTPCAITFRH